MPEKITNNYYSLSKMLTIIDKLDSLSNSSEAVLDFKKTTVFEGNLSALLGCINKLAFKKNIKLHFTNINASICKTLKENNFWYEEIENDNKNCNNLQTLDNELIKYAVFSTDGNSRLSFQTYLDSYFFPILNLSELVMTKDFKSVLGNNLDELYQNARTHGQSDLVHVCGYWNPDTSIMKFTMVDMGNTIPILVRSKKSLTRDSDCLEWATGEGNTTKSRDEAGGLGLFEIKKFTQKNQGKLHIISGHGYLGLSDDFENSNLVDFNCAFPGTMINLEINLNDSNVHYTLKDMDTLISSNDANIIRDLF